MNTDSNAIVWDHHPKTRNPILIAAFEGWNDGGNAASNLVRLLIKGFGGEKFASLDPEKTILLSAIGHIDITLPPQEDVSLYMKSTWGEIYSDFDDIYLMPKELEAEVATASGTVEADAIAPMAVRGGRVQSAGDDLEDEDNSADKKKASLGKPRAPAAAPRADNAFIRGQIGKGDAEIRLVTASGNIYVRRSK